ncbi:3461_t:CDS:2, partial [Scutellospora calospora]
NKATTIRCSLLNDNSIYNYPMDDNIKSNIPKYYRLSNEMLNKVELYYQYHIQPSKIINLLENKYPDYSIKLQNIYNVISQLRGTYKRLKNDAADLLTIESYLYKLYQSKQSWAYCFTTQVFNAEIQSTQLIEYYNNLIKSSVNQTSSLIKLNNAIQKRLDSENKYSRSQETINFDHNSNLQLIKHYDNEPELTDKCIEDNYNSQQIHINSMLNNMLDDKIQEAYSFLCTCTWPVSHKIYKDAYFNEPEDTFNNILSIRLHNNNPNRPVIPIQSNQNMLFNQFDQLISICKTSGSKKSNKKFLQDQICYSKSYKLLQTILILVMEIKTNEEVNDWCHQFIQQKKELLKANTVSSQD